MILDNSLKDKPVKILIVDDEQDIALILKKGLETEGFQVNIEVDPEQALAHFEPGKYDLLLLDISLPKMTGFELYREIRKIDRKSRVCFITAFEIYYDEFRKVFPKIHVTCFIRKPATISQLAKAIREELLRSPEEHDEQEDRPIPPAPNSSRQTRITL